MKVAISTALTLTLLSLPAAAAAGQAEGIADIVQAGQRVLIVDDQGRRLDGRVELVSDETVRVSTRAGSDDVANHRIVRIEKPDGLKNGALIGLGVGLGFGVVGATLVHGEGAESGQAAAVIVSNVLAYTLLGTGIDAVFNNRRTLYERGRRLQTRVAPVVGSGVRGAAVAVTW
jgi:hypothetical protein